MTTDQQQWLIGHVDAVRRLADSVRDLLDIHCLAASNEMRAVEYACNRARNAIEQETVNKSEGVNHDP